MIPESGAFKSATLEFTSIHIKQEKMYIVNREYPGSAQR